ncbi:hypothetical protein ACGFS9_20825 [Streptomyces sp. NPDC048566]|uniref:hypothetical protein n=1 Tax=Streptomyces sp. NPDC048566 TaxID=3365569 RepID=UPI00371CF97F
MITPADEGPDVEPDDPLALVLRPPSELLGPPAGRYRAVRRGAARRRLLRAAGGVGLVCAVAALVALPLRAAQQHDPAPPAVPLAPPPASSPSTVPDPSAGQRGGAPRPGAGDRSARPSETSVPSTAPTRGGTDRPSTRGRTPTPTPTPTPTAVRAEPSAVRTAGGPTPSGPDRR